MSGSAAVARLAARLPSQYLNMGHLTYWVSDLNDIAAVGTYVAQAAMDVSTYYTLIANVYVAMLQVSGGLLGTGLEELKVPLNNLLPSGAYVGANMPGSRYPVAQNGSYTIKPHDISKFLYCVSGTNTWTLLDALDYPEDFFMPLFNLTGANLTLARTNTGNTINSSVSNLTVASGAQVKWLSRISTTGFLVG